MEEKKLDPAVALSLIQAAEKDGPGDAILQVIVATQAERMNQAAKILNLEWNGAYNENHVKALCAAYLSATKLLNQPSAESAG